ncbi:MAG: MBL fold metallo-hydrolase, partial [Solirubrobacteraceae bacterium]
LVHAADQATLRKPGPKGGDASAGKLLRNLWRPANPKILGHTLRHGGARPARIDDAQTFADGDVLDVPGRFRVIHTPGHTPGHCALLLGRGDVLFVGDALITHELVTGGHGAQVMPSYFNVDTQTALQSLEALERLTAGLLLPGHGSPWHDGPAAAVESARRRLAADHA